DIINGNKMRFNDEFVRHKILDAIGDMSLIGLPIVGHVIANKSGHTLHVKLLRKLLLCKDSWNIVSDPANIKHAHAPEPAEVAVQAAK
ncbi:MAG: UDP-3-O-acyl-N-acetylglucosamine deacetylase, partial [Nitrospiraceae bacterium]